MKKFFGLRTPGRRGFTLIELLIVIAIILILIAIALPNFMEAQQRSKVAKAKAEGRTYAQALESYRLDFGGYPRDHDSIWPHPVAGDQDGYTQLTSPIKYLSSLPRDPWGEQVDTGGPEAGGVMRNRALYYEGGSGSDSVPQCGKGSRRTLYRSRDLRNWGDSRCIHAYLVLCIGPDANDGTSGNDEFPYGTTLWIYNPTNGTRSFGDIYKTVGEFKRGSVYRDLGGGKVAKYQQEGE